MPRLGYEELSGTEWVCQFDNPGEGYFGTFRNSYGSFNYVHAAVGSFGSYHNVPAGGGNGTEFATLTADYIYGTRIAAATTYSNWGTFTNFYAGLGTFDTLRVTAFATIANPYLAITAYADDLEVFGTTISDYGTFDYVRSRRMAIYDDAGLYQFIVQGPDQAGIGFYTDSGTQDKFGVYNNYGNWVVYNFTDSKWGLRINDNQDIFLGDRGTLGGLLNLFDVGVAHLYGTLLAESGTFFRVQSGTFQGAFTGSFATLAGAYADLEYITVDDGAFTLGTALTWVGNFLGFGTRYGSVSYAATRYGSFANFGNAYGVWGSFTDYRADIGTVVTLRGNYVGMSTGSFGTSKGDLSDFEVARGTNIVRNIWTGYTVATSSGADPGFLYFYENNASGILYDKVRVPFVKRKGDKYVQFYGSFHVEVVSENVAIYSVIGTASVGSAYTADTGGVYNYIYDISGWPDGEIFYARFRMRSTDAGDYGTLWNATIDILSM